MSIKRDHPYFVTVHLASLAMHETWGTGFPDDNLPGCLMENWLNAEWIRARNKIVLFKKLKYFDLEKKKSTLSLYFYIENNLWRNLLNKNTDSQGFWGRGGKQDGEREDVGLEGEVIREKHGRELPDFLKPLLVCQMNQITEYWIRKIYDWEFEEVTCDTKYVMWMRSLLFYWQKHIMSQEAGPLCITFPGMLHLTDSWAGASQPQGKQGQHVLRSYRAVFCVKLSET